MAPAEEVKAAVTGSAATDMEFGKVFVEFNCPLGNVQGEGQFLFSVGLS